MIHLRTFEDKLGEWMGRVLQIQRMTVHSDADIEPEKALSADGTALFSPVRGFTR